VRALDRKLLRDLRAIWAQALTIALVIACGTGGFIGSFATYDALTGARDAYYRDARFADVFAQVRRAPLSLEHELRDIPGVADVQLRVVWDVQLHVPETVRPVMGRMIGIVPADFETGLNGLRLRAGALPQAGERDAIVVNEAFAEARGLAPGDSIDAVVNGRLRSFSVSGVALSPEYVWASREGTIPDDDFGIFWIERAQLAAALDMTGAFNSLALKLMPGVSTQAVIAELDRMLARFGSRGAYDRQWQQSNVIVTQEMQQWRVNGIVLPSFFLAVSVFVLNIVMGRLVATQRDQVAALKALGYATGEIRNHYLKLAIAIAALGLALGLAVGIWFGSAITALYAEVFNFPDFRFALPPRVVLLSWLVTLAAAIAGTAFAVRQVVGLAPAEAMRPATPAAFRRTLLERLGFGHALGATPMMIARSIERRPLRALVTVLGIAGSIAVMVGGLWWRDSVEHLIDIQFNVAQPGEVQIGFFEAQPTRSVAELARLPGAIAVEGVRMVPVRLSHGHRNVRTALAGVAEEQRLRRFVDQDGRGFAIPAHGVVLARPLARRLGVAAGGSVQADLLEGEPRTVRLPVASIVDDLNGLGAYLDAQALHRLLGEGERASLAFVAVDRHRFDDFMRAVREIPGVGTIWAKTAALESFRKQTELNLLFFTSILTAFAASIAVGVVYNSARIALAERAWELATLRVLGLSKGEVSFLLLGELFVELMLAIPIGFVMGWGLAELLVALSGHDAMQIPVVIWPRTYAFAGLTMLAAGALSAWLVRRRIDRLDMVAVLKTRE
jgi:putative ABC transport system permease protein